MTTYPLTQPQLGIYFECVQHPEITEYNQPFVAHLPKTIDPDRLERALKTVYNARPELRTRYILQDGEPRQYVGEKDTLEVKRLTMTEAEAEEFVKNSVTPFDIYNEVLCRFWIIETPKEYVMLTQIHHLFADGMSLVMGFATRDFTLAYKGEPLPEIPYGQFDAALEEEASFATPEYARAKEYYREKYEGLNMVSLAKSTDQPMGLQIRHSEFIPMEVVDNWCKEHGTASNLLLMAAFSYVMGMLSREKNVIFTSLNHGRMDKRLRQSYGMYVRLVPTKAVIEPTQPVIDFVRSFRTELMSTIRYGIYPFSHFCRDLKMTQGVTFSYQGGNITEYLDFGDYQAPLHYLPKGNTCAELSTVVYEVDGQYDIRVESSEKLYDLEFLAKVSRAIKACVYSMMAQPDQPLSAVSIVSDEEKEQLMQLSKGKELPYNANETFVDMVMGHARQQPDATAVVDATGSYTYKEFDERSNALAAKLREQGVTTDTFVGIMMPRRKEFLLSVLAVQKAGGAYVPMDSEYPNDRLLYMLEDSEARVLITTKELYDTKCQEGDFTVDNVLFVEDWQEATSEPVNESAPDHLAYMIYTSGSTGKPKGVMQPHSSLRAYLAWRIHDLKFTPESRNAQHASFSFDASLDDLLCPLAAGGSVYIMPEEIRKDVNAMCQYLFDNGITGMTLSTQLGMTMLGLFNNLPLRYLMMGGEKMLPSQKTPVTVINGYGPTEFTVCSSYHIVDQDKDTDIPIGRAVPNTYSFICNTQGQLQPRGVAGELCLLGPQIARGYWKREDLTAEKFAECPFVPGVPMYRTGDLARYNDEGELEFLGRIDNQVKLRGFRIEMGEIENVAKRYEGVQDVAAEVRDINGTKHLCLYFTAANQVDLTSLQSFLAEQLTDYMVPEAYVQLDAMPLTPNGKVNRKALPSPVLTSNVEYVEPANETEKKIAALFADVLNYDEPVSAIDNFFALGGDSIKSIRLVSLLRNEGIVLQVNDVMKYKTVRGLAEIAGAQSASVDVSQEAVSGNILPSAIQQFFFQLQLPEPAHFNQSVILRAAQSIDKQQLENTLAALCRHHDMLRATVSEGQVIIRPENDEPLYELIEQDFRGVADVKASIKQAANQIHTSIDLEKGPIFKAALIHTDGGDCLLLVCHHIAVDGVSWRILIEDLNNVYAGGGLPRKTHSFSYFTETVSRYRDSYLLSQEKNYWIDVQRQMAGMPGSNGSDHSRKMQKVEVTLEGASLAWLLADASKAYNTDINDLLITALSEAYRQQTGRDGLSIQMEGHGREAMHEQLLTDRTVGWFTSAYPVVVEGLTGDIRHDIRLVKEMFRNLPNKGMGYGILQYIPSNEGDAPLRTDLTPLVGFNYLGEMGGATPGALFDMAADLPAGTMFSPKNVFGPSLMINCGVTAGVLSATFEYDTALWTADQAQAIADAFVTQLVQVSDHTATVKEPEQTASDLGAQGWTEAQYQRICERFAARGEVLQRVYPLSPMQEGMLLKFMMEPDTTAYRLLSRFSMSVLPTEQALRNTLDVLAAKHEVLRTAIIYDGVAEPCQAIVSRQLGLEMVDLTGESDIEKAAARVHQEQLHRPLSLQDDPLMRVVCMKTSENTCQMLFVLHHIIVDGWCIPIYMNDFIQSLAANMTSGTSQAIVEGRPGMYEQFVRQLRQKDKKAGLAYWKQLLEGYETKAAIPTVSIPSGNAGENIQQSVSQMLDLNVMSALRKLCSQSQVTMNTVVELAWGLVLQTWCRTQDAVFAKVVSGRNNDSMNVDTLVGLFINSVPVRVQASAEVTVREALQTLQAQAAETAAYDFCSLSEIQTQSELGANLFQSILAFENYAGADSLSQGQEQWGLQVIQSEEEAFNELSVTVTTNEQGFLTLKLTYDATKYTPIVMQRVLDTFVTLIAGMAEHPEHLLKQLPLLSQEAHERMLEISTGKYLEVDITKTFAEVFEARAKLVPDNVAVVDKCSQLTYSQLSHYSDVLAHKLIAAGVQPNDFVCVMLDRMKEFPLSVLAIHKAGAAYTPLDFEYPNERLCYMLENSQSKVLITSHDVLKAKQEEGDFDTGSAQIIFVEDIDFNAAAEPINLTTPDNLAYMIYTSGSTGKPKGAMLHQAGLWNFINVVIDMEHLTAEDRIEGHRSFSFDAHIEDMYAILTLGGSFHIMPTEIRKDLDAIRQFLFDHQITGGGYSTAIAALLLNTYDDLPVRFITAGGEKLDGVFSDHIEIINVYGPTECTDDTSYYKIAPGERVDNIPIGKSVANCYNFIIDTQGRLLPQGVAGELCFAGIQVGRGYWQLPDRTAQAFGDCPFVENDPWGRRVRMYHTGDICRWNEQGDIEYLGRIDFQVKLRGFRIELGEIENKVLQIEGIRQAAAEVRKVAGADHLLLYYTLDEGVTIDSEDIRAALTASSLAEYMVPDTYVPLDTMPLTPNGKINRRVLPIPEIKTAEMVAPANDTEQQIWNVVSQLLRVEEFGVTTNLISIGLTSLSAMRLSARLGQEMQLNIPTNEILTKPTIRQMAALQGQQSAQVTPLTVYEKQEFYPLTENQGGVYIDCQQNPEALQYNIPEVIKFTTVAAEDLLKAVKAVVAAHPYLKAHLVLKDGDVLQQRRDDAPDDIVFKTLDFEPDADWFQERVRPYNIFTENLYRLEIYQSPSAVWLFKDFHHLIFDGLSNGLFLGQTLAVLNGETLKQEHYTAFDHALDQKSIVTTEKFAEAEAYFDQLLTDAVPTIYPKSVTPENNEAGTNSLYLTFHKGEIQSYCSKHGFTENNFFMTAFLQVLHRITREKRVLISTINNGREANEMQEIMGMFVKTLPMISNMSDGKQPMADAVETIQHQLFESVSRDFYPFTKMAARHDIHPAVMFTFQGDLGVDIQREGIEQIRMKLDTAKVPLSVTVASYGETDYVIFLEYNTSMYAADDMQALADALQTFALKSIGENVLLKDISLVEGEQFEELMQISKGEEMDFDRSLTYVKEFVRQAAKTPDALAVTDKFGQFTYAELDAQSNVIARLLLQRGVGPDCFVGVMLDRQKEFSSAVLGIQKAGNAYVPLDFDYPTERLLYMLEDSEARVLITTHEVVEAKGMADDLKNIEIIYVDQLDSKVSDEPIDLSDPAQVAYMIYTSGSTGKPKGVMIPHSAKLNFIHFIVEKEQLTAADRILCHRAFSFDASLEDLYPILTVGGSLHIVPSEIRKDLPEVYKFMNDHQITGGGFNTTVGVMLMTNFDLPLRFVGVGGEKLDRVPGNIPLWNMYGPTECTVDSTYFLVDPTKEYKNIPIGYPVPNNWGFIIDSAGQLLPRGMAGELCIAGNQVGKGYWNRPEMTAERYVDCPWVPGVKMYHTGDLCRWNSEGQIEYLGRIDFQVKLRGYRIELGEIENEIGKYPHIKAACAEVREVNGAQHLCCYFTSSEEIDTADLKHTLAQTLTEYMVPTVYMPMESMPMTPSGKIDRKKLPEPVIERHTENVAPRTHKETVLLDIARKLLKADDFGVTDDLFELGMTSIIAVKFVALADRENIKLKANDVMKLHTIDKILSANMSLGYWFNSYTPEKPVLIVTQGILLTSYLTEKFRIWQDHFSIFTIEPTDEHFQYIFQDATFHEVIEMYFTVLDLMIPADAKVFGFLGYSWGGVQAYHLACKWRDFNGVSLPVWLGDSHLRNNEETERQMQEFERQIERTMPELLKKKHDMIKHLEDNVAYPHYDGKVILYNAKKLNPLEEYNLNEWRKIASQLEIIDVDDEHNNLFMTENYNDLVTESLVKELTSDN